MSDWVHDLLKRYGLFAETTHEDRVEIDREIEKRHQMNCDDAVKHGLVSKEELEEIVALIRQRKKKKKPVVPMVI